MRRLGLVNFHVRPRFVLRVGNNGSLRTRSFGGRRIRTPLLVTLLSHAEVPPADTGSHHVVTVSGEVPQCVGGKGPAARRRA